MADVVATPEETVKEDFGGPYWDTGICSWYWSFIRFDVCWSFVFCGTGE
jgi:hypothetical protein